MAKAPTKSEMVAAQINALKKLKGMSVEAGWFETNLYTAGKGIPDSQVGVPVARIARIQEFGATIHHPGGTKYITDAIVGDRFVGTRFVHKDFPGEHETTKAHIIVIPARPFMRKAWLDFSNNRKAIQNKIAHQLIEGRIQPAQALGQIGMALEGYIVKSIKNGGWQENAPSTVAKKGFNKPLIDSGQMWQTVSSKVGTSS